MTVELYRTEFARTFLQRLVEVPAWHEEVDAAVEAARLAGERVTFDNDAWRRLLTLAELYGWRPLGTKVPGDRAWSGGYLDNAGQTVTDRDAAALGAALRAASAVPRNPGVASALNRIAAAAGRGAAREAIEALALVFEDLGHEDVTRFAAYCRRGFEIY